jgi:hypothetical protein
MRKISLSECYTDEDREHLLHHPFFRPLDRSLSYDVVTKSKNSTYLISASKQLGTNCEQKPLEAVASTTPD